MFYNIITVFFKEGACFRVMARRGIANRLEENDFLPIFAWWMDLGVSTIYDF